VTQSNGRTPSPFYQSATAAIIDSSDDAIVSKDLTGIVTSWNPGAERIFGYTADEMIGQSITRILPKDRQQEEAHILATIVKGEKVDHFQSIRQRKDGRLIHVSVTISPIRDDQGKIIGASKIARDISEQKRIEEERATADRRKDEFLAMLGHELRNPLAPIRTAADLLRLGAPLDEMQSQARDMIERQVRHLSRLVDDLLDVGRITSGIIMLRPQLLDLASVISDALDTTRTVVRTRQHRLVTSVAGGSLYVMGDATRLAQMFANLVNNAAKYTPEGGYIEVTCERTDTHAVIHVKDSGIGIEPELLDHVFDLFAQGKRGSDRSEGGLGIGLTLVRRIVELHEGTVEAHSEGNGRGSEFIVRLPLAEEPKAKAGRKAPQQKRAIGKRKILVVDDNIDAASSLSMLMRLEGHDTREVHDGKSALSLVNEWNPDIVLLDIGLPEIDGYRVATELRRQGYKGTLIAITGYGMQTDREKALDAGFDLHLTKPVDTETLKECFLLNG
jgi:PAS domain S-box-containing protein